MLVWTIMLQAYSPVWGAVLQKKGWYRVSACLGQKQTNVPIARGQELLGTVYELRLTHQAAVLLLLGSAVAWLVTLTVRLVNLLPQKSIWLCKRLTRPLE
jgi:predicted anti-sigma-YlaC factor YlaD